MCYFVTVDGVELTEGEVNKILSLLPSLDCPEDVNLLTPKEIEELLTDHREYSPYSRAEIHGY